ncbi:hypothetical protein CEUSTIGMA_g2598.t1 [Chlamydomonas eustigma]|uniref:HAT C-terminal dimerisation domain-containing protein n=1 Tax=Chlamydomonas eustigma TaxID=1157962 RepID=A0A250WWE7_9CHLO|nr:hypothetical protein CEUSTIGMA_g2598.t1 [Chlamydomonas eustigma]|eukprot:GAX75154.1 hypothetical protein CEUSTIGMA_g2598.t1 [Chlamydomonas eustigma]
MVDSVIKNKAPLAATVVQPEFSITSDRAKRIKARCISGQWFEKLAFTQQVLEPIVVALTSLQSDNCSQADAYWLLRDLMASLEALKEELRLDEDLACVVASVRQKVQDRLEYGYHPCQALAAMLHPKYKHRMMSIPQAERKAAEYLFTVLASRQVLLDVALRVTGLPATSYAGERVFSALNHHDVWSDNKRARMHIMGRDAMSGFVYFNKRVIIIHLPETSSFPSYI